MNERYSLDELISMAVAREINDYENIVIGVGIPITACVLAKGLHAKNAILMTESGLIGFDPLVPVVGIADVGASRGFSYSTDLFSMFTTHTYRGFIDKCFLGCGQIDKFGNINSTAIGDYKNLETAKSKILSVIENLKQGEVEDEELEAAKNIVVSGYVSSLETTNGQAAQLAQGEFFAGDPLIFKNYFSRIGNVTK